MKLLALLSEIELQLDDVPSSAAEPFRAATQLLRAASLAFQDNSLRGPSAIARPCLEGPWQDSRLPCCVDSSAVWAFGTSASLIAFIHYQDLSLGSSWSKSGAVSAMLDLSIEAAVALEHLHLACAKWLASDALKHR